MGAGHRFALPSTGLEIGDAAQIFPALRTASAPGPFAAILNQVAGDIVQMGEDQRAHLRVIDPGTWAQFFQRHMLQAGEQTYDFLQDKWGVTDEAKTFRVQAGPLLKRLTLYRCALKILAKRMVKAFFHSRRSAEPAPGMV